MFIHRTRHLHRHLKRATCRTLQHFSTQEPGFTVSSLGNGHVELIMSSPPVNTFSMDMLNNFRRTIEELETNPKVKGLVLSSSVQNIFTAGLDLNELHKPTPEEFKRFWGTFEMAWVAYYMTPLATVAAIDGACPALGCVLALSSDYRVMTNEAKYRIGLNETSLGMNPPEWLRHLCTQTLGARNAELHLTSSTMCTPQEAKDINYVDQIVEKRELRNAAINALTKLTSVPDLARAQCKQGFRKHIAALADHDASVDVMADSCLGVEFQDTLDGIMQQLKKKKKKK